MTTPPMTVTSMVGVHLGNGQPPVTVHNSNGNLWVNIGEFPTLVSLHGTVDQIRELCSRIGFALADHQAISRHSGLAHVTNTRRLLHELRDGQAAS